MTEGLIDKGRGRPIVMLHGMFGHASNWQGTIDILSSKYRTIALELPYTELDKENCNVEYLSDHVLRFADSHGIDKATFMGNSLGGHIALDLAVKNKDRVDALVLTGSSGLSERGFEKDLEIHPSRPYVRKKVEAMFFSKDLATDELVESVYETLLDKKSKLKIVRLTKSAKDYNMKDLLHEIDCDTLLIWGRQDTITPPDIALQFEKKIKNVRLEFLDNCRHAPMMEHPKEFGRMVLEFLSLKR